jgi:hypothetical protein
MIFALETARVLVAAQFADFHARGLHPFLGPLRRAISKRHRRIGCAIPNLLQQPASLQIREQREGIPVLPEALFVQTNLGHGLGRSPQRAALHGATHDSLHPALIQLQHLAAPAALDRAPHGHVPVVTRPQTSPA